MATANIVSMLLEGGGTIGGNVPDMPQYTMESGAALIARESTQELHEIFEVAIVETNEAALGAYLEGSEDVMESAAYGPVFEEAEKKAGNKIIEFLQNLKTKVFAFFRNILDRVTLAVNNYEKFYEKHKEALGKATPLSDCPCVAWNDKNINYVPSGINKAAADIGNFASQISSAIKDMTANGVNDENITKCKNAANGFISGVLSSMGIPNPGAGKQYDATEIHNKITETLRGKDTVKKTIDAAYIKGNLEGTKKAAAEVKNAQKMFNNTYDSVIKNIKALKDMMDKSQKKGITQHLNYAVSTLSKGQNIINAYAGAGYAAIVARATEAKKLANAMIAGKVPGEKKKDDEKKDN